MRTLLLSILGFALLFGTLQAGDLIVDGAVTATSVTASGNVIAGGNVTASGNVTAGGNVTASDVTATGALTAASASITGNLTVDSATLKVDAANNRIGIGMVTPARTLDVRQSGGNDVVACFGAWSNVAGSSGGYGVFGSNFYQNTGVYRYTNTHGTMGYAGMITCYGSIRFANGAGATTVDAEFTPAVNMAIIPNGNVGIGIGTATPQHKLDVLGALQLRDIPDTSVTVTSGRGILYSSGGRLKVADAGHNKTNLASHIDPREVCPTAQTSFSDLNVEYPFSFYHKNPLLGKEQAVDMAKLVGWAERKMKEELGQEAGRLVFTRSLPMNECLTIAQHNQQQSERQAQAVIDQLEQMPWIKVAVGTDGSVPPEALEEVPEVREVERTVTVEEKTMDFEAGKIVSVQKTKTTTEQVPTGRMKRQFRDGWELRRGELYRKPTLKDINVNALIAATPQLPQWILDRIQAGQQTSMDVKALAEQIRQILAARESENPIRQAAQIIQ